MIVLPEIAIKKNLDILLKKYYTEYKDTNQANQIGTISLKNGYDWSANNEAININGTDIIFNQNNGSITDVITHFNTQLSLAGINNIYVYDAGVGRVGLQTNVKTESVQSYTLSDPISGNSAISTFGFRVGTFTGTLDKYYSRLYLLFAGLEYDNYIWLDEIVKILKDTYTTKKRPIKIYQNYNRIPKESPPLIIITFSGEQQDQRNIGISARAIHSQDKSISECYFEHYKANFSLHIISDNNNECALLYNFLKCVIRSNLAQFRRDGLHEFEISGGNTNVETQMPNLFDWIINLSFSYDYNIPFGFERNISPETFEQNFDKINGQVII